MVAIGDGGGRAVTQRAEYEIKNFTVSMDILGGH